jgi:hypothetical protein
VSYRLLTYRVQGQRSRAGLLIENSVVDLDRAARAAAIGDVELKSALSVVESREPLLKQIAGHPKARAGAKPLAEVAFCAPLLYPRNICCAAVNS